MDLAHRPPFVPTHVLDEDTSLGLDKRREASACKENRKVLADAINQFTVLSQTEKLYFNKIEILAH